MKKTIMSILIFLTLVVGMLISDVVGNDEMRVLGENDIPRTFRLDIK